MAGSVSAPGSALFYGSQAYNVSPERVFEELPRINFVVLSLHASPKIDQQALDQAKERVRATLASNLPKPAKHYFDQLMAEIDGDGCGFKSSQVLCEVAFEFIEHGNISAEEKTDMQKSLMLAAAKFHSLPTLQKLIAASADVNVRDGSNNTPLHWAATLTAIWSPSSCASIRRLPDDNAEVITVLLDANANYLALNDERKTPFDEAFRLVHAASHNIIRAFIAHPKITADVRYQMRGLDLFDCVFYRSEKEVQQLCQDPETDLNYQDPETGYTALHIAAVVSKDRCLEVLLAAKADHTKTSLDGYLPLDLLRATCFATLASHSYKIYLSNLCHALYVADSEAEMDKESNGVSQATIDNMLSNLNNLSSHVQTISSNKNIDKFRTIWEKEVLEYDPGGCFVTLLLLTNPKIDGTIKERLIAIVKELCNLAQLSGEKPSFKQDTEAREKLLAKLKRRSALLASP